jgi:hypothetical protein
MSELSLLNALAAEEALDLDGAIRDADPPIVPMVDHRAVLVDTPSNGLPGQYTGWHFYGFPKNKFPCIGGPCMMASPHRNNYWRCDPCCMVKWFESKITTFQGDDKERACAMVRLDSTEPLKVHREMMKVFKTFRERGGQIHVLALQKDLPTILQLNARICSVKYPAHLPMDSLRGTGRAIDRANALALVVPNPWEAEDQEDN